MLIQQQRDDNSGLPRRSCDLPAGSTSGAVGMAAAVSRGDGRLPGDDPHLGGTAEPVPLAAPVPAVLAKQGSNPRLRPAPVSGRES